jgi:hypothetical protein
MQIIVFSISNKFEWRRDVRFLLIHGPSLRFSILAQWALLVPGYTIPNASERRVFAFPS